MLLIISHRLENMLSCMCLAHKVICQLTFFRNLTVWKNQRCTFCNPRSTRIYLSNHHPPAQPYISDLVMRMFCWTRHHLQNESVASSTGQFDSSCQVLDTGARTRFPHCWYNCAASKFDDIFGITHRKNKLRVPNLSNVLILISRDSAKLNQNHETKVDLELLYSNPGAMLLERQLMTIPTFTFIDIQS